MTSDVVIEVSAISKVFARQSVETRALRDVSLQVRRGEFLSIEGPSGSGKSTLLAILGLLEIPTAGTYSLAGVETSRMDPSARARVRNRHIGYVFQSFNLIDDLTVRANVALPLKYRGMSASDGDLRVSESLARVGLSDRADHFPAQLSGGQQQRAAVARAIVGAPDLVLADEPTGNLDSENGASVMELLADLHRAGATICMVTHDPRYAQFAQRAVMMNDGLLRERR